MKLLSSVDVAIRSAQVRGTLRVEESFNVRLGVPFWAISDEIDLICVAMSAAEAEAITRGLWKPADALAA